MSVKKALWMISSVFDCVVVVSVFPEQALEAEIMWGYTFDTLDNELRPF